MGVPNKSRWTVVGSGGGDARNAIDDRYATTWSVQRPPAPGLTIDLGEVATLAGLEVYWGGHFPVVYRFDCSLDGESWIRLCATRHGEGGQDVFAFLPTPARHLRWTCEDPPSHKALEIVEINLYGPDDAARVLEGDRTGVLSRVAARVPAGACVTVDLGAIRYPLGAFIEWGEAYGTDFSVYLSDDGESFRDVGRITTGNGDSDSFWWRSTTARFVRLTIHSASSPDGAVVNELKIRVLNKDRMPIGRLERLARSGRGDLYPQSLVGRQVYWTAIGEFKREQEALFDEYGNLEPKRGGGMLAPLLRIGDAIHGGPGAAPISQSLVEGSLPIPSVAWIADGVQLGATALAHHGQAKVEYRITNRSESVSTGALLLVLWPVQINPYWQHGGHAVTNAIALEGVEAKVNDRAYAMFSEAPSAFAIADLGDDDLIARLADEGATAPPLESDSGLLSAACEFSFRLAPGESRTVVVSLPMRDGVTPDVDASFPAVRDRVVRAWRKKLGPRRITVGDSEVSDTVEAQIALILVNATRHAFKPGPRNYDRTWIRDGSSQALALLWAGLIDEARDYVLWYAKRIYDSGLVPPILNVNGSINRGYGSDIEYDAQGEFVGIAAEVYRVTRDREFLKAIFEPVVRATRFIDELCAQVDASHGRESPLYGLLAPSISHEGYNKPSFSYWDDYFAVSAWRNCAYLASEIGDADEATHTAARGNAFAANLARSIRLTSESLGRGLVAASGDREDVDPSSTSIAFEPCRADDVLPAEFIGKTYDLVAERVRQVREPGFQGTFTPYALRTLNAFVSLGRVDDAFALLASTLDCRRPIGWRLWAEVVYGDARAPEYIGDMPHTWIGAEFATAVRRMILRENGTVLELFRATPDAWWDGEGITLRNLPTAFGITNLRATRQGSRATVELSLAGGLAPERILVRCPGARRALADGKACVISGDFVLTANLSHLVVDF
jgi:hypothetical protein